MPIELRTQQQLRAVQTLPFCYWCGAAFAATDDCDRDHVPPSTLFLGPDRDVPLILRTHRGCNHQHHLEDQTIGQLVGILHNVAPDPGHPRIQMIAGVAADGDVFIGAGGFDLRAIIRRWVFGFHAALYGEFLNPGQSFMTFPPLAEGNRDDLQIAPVPAIVPELVKSIRHNRQLGQLDRIVTRNGKCVYECVWLESDAPGTWFCCYALDLYGWLNLGDIDRFGRRGCVGAYVREDGSAVQAGVRGTRHPDDFLPIEPLDPFY